MINFIFKFFLLFNFLFIISFATLANEDHILILKNKYPQCKETEYLHNCFYERKLDAKINVQREIGFWKNNSIWEGYVFEGNQKIFTYKKGEAKSSSPCNKRNDWWYCPGRKYKILDVKQNKYLILFENGNSFEGQIKNNIKNGFGIFIDKIGLFTYKGKWKNDRFHGYGKYIWENGDEYHGEFLDGKFHGLGKIISHNGKEVEGMFEKGKFLYEKKKPISSSNSKIEGYKIFCSEIGFTPGTEKFGECVVEAMKKG